jgi:hypothetical protein
VNGFTSVQTSSFQVIISFAMKNATTSWFLLACWVDFLVCPRRHFALLPARQRANLFAD